MSSAQPPHIAGVAGGVGVTTIAHALRGHDAGVHRGQPVQVLVCRATSESLIRAAHIIGRLDHQPILAVSCTDSGRPGRTVMTRMQLIAPHTARTVLLPHVDHWRALSRPLDAVRDVVDAPRRELGRQARRWAEAVEQIAGSTPRVAATIVPLPAGGLLRPEHTR
ncbi:hypothetical protein SAMN05216377_11511 [Pseudonocardia oroxyli]|uniref:Uncharacterized protein n=2 Tax=Pseudonocardia oroxyli TaxID=366584 RepID=A0A1G7WXA9_PSEOR|nr:hypothetical protein SAMN05216377_11511 [Pseudonocardia oroxyli]